MPKNKLYIFFLVVLLSCFNLQGQNEQKKIPIKEVLDKIASQHRVTFNYESDLLVNIEVYPLKEDSDLSQKISNLEKQTNLVFNRASELIITIYRPVKICGYIKDQYLRQPLGGATISCEYTYDVSDENGYFEIEVKSLNDLLSIRYIGFKTIQQKARLFDLEECGIITLVEQVEEMSSVLLQGYLIKGIDINQDWTTAIDYDKFSLLPGLIEADVLQTVQALPSVFSVDDTVSNINIRGGSNDQNLMLWDGIKMYQTGHFFGLISSFNPYMTNTANVINNGTDVAYTDGVSGSILMQTDKKLNSKFNGSFGLNFLNAELFTDIPIGEASSLQLASRKSIDDFFRTPTYKVYFDRVTQETEAEENTSEVSNSNQEFNFHDISLRWLYKLKNNDLLRFNFILIDNNLSFNETATRNESQTTRESSLSQNSLAFGLHYKRNWNQNLVTDLSIYNTDYKLGSTNADILSDQLFSQENKVSESGIKLQNVWTDSNWEYKLGYNFTETEVINLNDIDQPRFVRRDEEVLREHALFGQAWYNNSKKGISIRGGIRANYITKFKKTIIEPRLSFRKTLGENIEIEALGEFKHQNISQIVNFQNDFLGIEKRRWQLTDIDTIPIMKSKQVSIGLLYKKNGWLLDGKMYYKNVEGITSQSQSFTTKYEFERTRGDYDIYGFEILLRKKFKNFNSWLSYAHMDNNYTFEDLEENSFPSNFDLTNAITLGSTYNYRAWNISAGINYRTGNPSSIPISGNEVVDGNINFDRANNVRLKDYLRIDASALYKFRISSTLKSEVGASIWNVSNRENTINNYYRVDENNSSNRFSRFSLGLTTNAVVRIFF